MSNTKRDPLLSERLWEIIKSLDGNVANWVIDDLTDIHEDLDNMERSKQKAKCAAPQKREGFFDRFLGDDRGL
jgi:hypothetical protein